MTIRTKQSLRALYARHAEQNPLADTIDCLELTAEEAGLPVEVVEAVVNEETTA